jgi:hypothetical protein
MHYILDVFHQLFHSYRQVNTRCIIRRALAGRPALKLTICGDNEALAPSPAETEWANQVVAAFKSGPGVATLNGRMLDRPHLRLATRILSHDCR